MVISQYSIFTDTLPELEPVVAPTPTPSASVQTPNMRHSDEKDRMLDLINATRVQAGLGQIVLGSNEASQLHAEASLKSCSGSHWGTDGTKPYMRYSLAGGYQSNGAAISGRNYCITKSDGYSPIDSLRGWMSEQAILDPWHKKVNIGLAWDQFNTFVVQHFEGDYVEYDTLPAISDSGVLSLAGQVKNGAQFDQDDYFDISIYYDHPPHGLTRGQLARTYCYDSGLPVAYVRKPLSGGRYYNEDSTSTTYSLCANPYHVSPEAPPARSPDEAHSLRQTASEAGLSLDEIPVTAPSITAREWEVIMDEFRITADLGKVLDVHGQGVYTIIVWGTLGGEITPISEYSIFHGVEPPDTYDPDSP